MRTKLWTRPSRVAVVGRLNRVAENDIYHEIDGTAMWTVSLSTSMWPFFFFWLSSWESANEWNGWTWERVDEPRGVWWWFASGTVECECWNGCAASGGIWQFGFTAVWTGIAWQVGDGKAVGLEGCEGAGGWLWVEVSSAFYQLIKSLS